jgi:hypothetical protein
MPLTISRAEGIKAGQTIKTQAPDGHIFKFTVPAGVKGGDMVQVEVPPQEQRQLRTVKVSARSDAQCWAGQGQPWVLALLNEHGGVVAVHALIGV